MLKKIADSVRKDAVDVIESAIETKDKDLQKMWNDDAADLMKVADLIESGEVYEAYCHARHMDTAAREQINEDAWDILCTADELHHKGE